MPASAWRTPWTVAKPKTPAVAVRWRERRRSRPHPSRRRPNLTRNTPTQPQPNPTRNNPTQSTILKLGPQWEGGRIQKKPSKKPQKASEPPVTRLLAKRSMMRGQRGSRSAPTLPELRRDRDRRRAVLASIRAADDVLETDLQSDEILACFEEALGERQPEMGTDAVQQGERRTPRVRNPH